MAQLQLFYPFKKETELYPYDEERCKKLFLQTNRYGNNKIQEVKKQLFEHLDTVEEARQLVSEGM